MKKVGNPTHRICRFAIKLKLNPTIAILESRYLNDQKKSRNLVYKWFIKKIKHISNMILIYNYMYEFKFRITTSKLSNRSVLIKT